MKRWIVLIVAVIVLTAAVTFMTQNVTNSELGPTAHAVNESKGPQPRVEIGGSLLYEFGKMSQFRKSSHVWEVKNVGNADLEMWMESSTCSCTIAKLATPPDAPAKTHVRVKPNETTPIELEWDTKQFQNEYSKGATIGTNDPARPEIRTQRQGSGVSAGDGLSARDDHAQRDIQRRGHPDDGRDLFDGHANDEGDQDQHGTPRVLHDQAVADDSRRPEEPECAGRRLPDRRRGQARPAARQVFRHAGDRDRQPAPERNESFHPRLCDRADQRRSPKSCR